jgi:hypothetical protein
VSEDRADQERVQLVEATLQSPGAAPEPAAPRAGNPSVAKLTLSPENQAEACSAGIVTLGDDLGHLLQRNPDPAPEISPEAAHESGGASAVLAADAPPRHTPPKLDRRAALRAPKLADQPHRRLSYRKMVKRSRSASRTLSTGVPCAHRAERAAGLGTHAAGGLLKPDANAVLEVARQPLPGRHPQLAGTILKALLDHQVSSSLLAESHRPGAAPHRLTSDTRYLSGLERSEPGQSCCGAARTSEPNSTRKSSSLKRVNL